jgi:hypothetical protein
VFDGQMLYHVSHTFRPHLLQFKDYFMIIFICSIFFRKHMFIPDLEQFFKWCNICVELQFPVLLLYSSYYSLPYEQLQRNCPDI